MMIIVSLLMSGAIFGFFYAWVCSTMWGLDSTDPRVAMGAMQAMNASVRNAVFAPAFFGTPIVLLAAGAMMYRIQLRRAAVLFWASAIVYVGGCFIVTMGINVPMNEALATFAIPDQSSDASVIWETYSVRWQFWNQLRTVFAGVSFVVAVCAALDAASAGAQR
jgi:uncharacterized membrane protein